MNFTRIELLYLYSVHKKATVGSPKRFDSFSSNMSKYVNGYYNLEQLTRKLKNTNENINDY